MNAQSKALSMVKGKYLTDIVKGIKPLHGRMSREVDKAHMVRYGKRVTLLLLRLKHAGVPYGIEIGPDNTWYNAHLIFPDREVK